MRIRSSNSRRRLPLDADEYGNPRGTTTSRYGWLGGKQRSTDTLAGLTLMGVRLYHPGLGRFLQTDPVPGGSCNDYDYTCADPINKEDLTVESWALLRAALPAHVGDGAARLPEAGALH